jgi:hypothetical protein
MARGNRNRARNGNRTTVRKQVLDILNSQRELKLYEFDEETTGPVNGTVSGVTQEIVLGDAFSQRDGSQITVKELLITVEFALHASASFDFVRYIVFADKSSAGVVPAVTDVINFADPASGYHNNVLCSKRFKILLDKNMALSSAGNTKVVTNTHKVKLRNHPVYYTATTNVAGANSTGAIYFLCITDEATNVSAYNCHVTVLYYDS